MSTLANPSAISIYGMFVSKEDYLQSQAEGQKTIAHNICNKTINKNRSDVFPDNDTENLYTLEIWGEFI